MFWHTSLKFQSILSSQRVTKIAEVNGADDRFQSTLSSQRVTQFHCYLVITSLFQSTLSSQRVTKCTRTIGRCGFNFNPHSPRREWLRNARKSGIHTTFQSTLSSQRVTTYYKWEKLVFNNFNPHSPRREWPTADVLPDALRDFNPHSPRREWRKRISYQRRSVCISIHTLLAESDISTIFKFTCTCNFNPHSPRREWPESQIQC